MITARSAYQVFKSEQPNGSVSDFNSLPVEEGLVYKIASAEETLLASLAIVEANEEQKSKYAVSVVHAASAYVSHLISYLPLSARSQTAKKIDIDYDAIVRTVMLFGSSAALFESVKKMVLHNAPATQVSLTDLSDLEGALNNMEKEYRQKAKDAGEKTEMLKKVAPEPVVVVAAAAAKTPSTPVLSQTSDGNGEGSAAVRDSPTAAGRRRPRSDSAERNAAAQQSTEGENNAMEGEGNAVVKAVRTETEGRGEQTGTAAAAAVSTAADGVEEDTAPLSSLVTAPKARKPVKAGAKGLVWGRLRGLTANEKKAVGVLQGIIQILAHVYATKFNDLVPLFDLFEEKVKTVQFIVDSERAQYEAKEDKKPPEPFHEVDLAYLRGVLDTSSHIFRTDEECRYELDEDLLHPIAYACVSLINQIEGYTTEPFKAPTPEDLAKKQQLRDAARAKREEAQRRIVEKAEAKAELERKKEEEKQLMRRRLGDHDAEDDSDLVEDMALTNPSALGYVAYASELPLGSTALFEKALYVWSMIVSVPRALNLSQMHFATFVKGILCEDQDSNGLMEEVTKCLLEVSMEVVRVSSPNTPRIATRGKNWFEALVEFVGVASGNKKKRQQQQRRREPSTEEEEDDDDEDEDDDDSSDFGSHSTTDEDEEEAQSSSSTSSQNKSSSRSSNNNHDTTDKANTDAKPSEGEAGEEKQQQQQSAVAGENGSAVKAEEEEVDTDPFSLELKATMENIAALRSLATWGNVDVVDRLNLLQFCVQEALSSEDVRNEADRLQKESEEEVVSTEKKLKEIRDEAEKELRALLRTLPAATSAATSAAAAAKKKKKATGRRGAGAKKGPAVKAEDGGEGAEEDDANSGDEQDADEGNDPQQDAVRNYEEERENILKAVDKKRADVYAHLFGAQDGKDDGAIVQPLGMDRYRRLYWRFPLERVVYVQTAPYLTAGEFPTLPEPEELRRQRATSRAMLLDDEEVVLPSTRGRGRGGHDPLKESTETAKGAEEGAAATQKTWGTIPFEYLSTFVQTLDRRGKREAPLRHALETLAPYLSRLEEFKEGRVTRSRANMFGYMNNLKVDFTY